MSPVVYVVIAVVGVVLVIGLAALLINSKKKPPISPIKPKIGPETSSIECDGTSDILLSDPIDGTSSPSSEFSSSISSKLKEIEDAEECDELPLSIESSSGIDI